MNEYYIELQIRKLKTLKFKSYLSIYYILSKKSFIYAKEFFSPEIKNTGIVIYLNELLSLGIIQTFGLNDEIKEYLKYSKNLKERHLHNIKLFKFSEEGEKFISPFLDYIESQVSKNVLEYTRSENKKYLESVELEREKQVLKKDYLKRVNKFKSKQIQLKEGLVEVADEFI